MLLILIVFLFIKFVIVSEKENDAVGCHNL